MRAVILMLAVAMNEDEGWRPLMNGKDLSGWETWLTKPHKSSVVDGLKKNEKGDYAEALGLNRDPNQVFSIVEVDGHPALRISGEVWGGISTKEEFENYHFRAEFKWGQKKWPPREKTVRDNGLLYHCVGRHGAQSGLWMKSFEMQIQERDCGDFHSLAGAMVDVAAARKDPKSPLVYTPGAPVVAGVTQRILKNPDAEKPTGEWNTVEFYCHGQTSAHVVNGVVNMVLTNLRHADNRPLTKGRIQIQSEGAEIYWRNLEVKPIAEIPRPFLE